MSARRRRVEARRHAVLAATLRLLARAGPRAVTHRAVAREAGTSVRAITYSFASRRELLVEALRHYASTAIARFEALAVPPASLLEGAGDPLDMAASLLAEAVISDFVDDRDGLVAELELVLECARNPALADDYRRWQESLEAMILRYTDVLGSTDPALDTRLVLATLRGLELEALARPDAPPDRADLVRVFRRALFAVSSG